MPVVMEQEYISSQKVYCGPSPYREHHVCPADEVDGLMRSAGMEQRQLCMDRRLQVNRGRQIKMYRVWLQAKYARPCPGTMLEPSLRTTLEPSPGTRLEPSPGTRLEPSPGTSQEPSPRTT